MADKYQIRNEIKNYGREFDNLMVEILGKYDTVDDINISTLPKQFVLKCTHDSGSVIICRDKEKFDLEQAKIKLGEALKTDYWKQNVELQYKDVPKEIIAEKYLDNYGEDICDYKLYCFNGSAKLVYVSSSHDDGKSYRMNFFDLNWNMLPITRKGTIPFEKTHQRPLEFDKMVTYAEKFSKNFPFVRVDFFVSNGRIYLSEMTFVPNAGLAKYMEPEIDKKLGGLLKI